MDEPRQIRLSASKGPTSRSGTVTGKIDAITAYFEGRSSGKSAQTKTALIAKANLRYYPIH
jgi:hypothetical protein